MNCKTLLLTIAVAIGMLISGCAPAISIEITTPPPATLEVNLSATIAATVMHDSSDKGVDWSCTPAGSCGTFTPAHTASGASTVYMAPRTSGPVVIVAASTANPKKVAHAPVTINPVATAGDLTGTYTFFVNGTDTDLEAYSVAGSVVLGGAKITGEQDYFDLGTGKIFPTDPIVNGSISVGSDGRGTLTLTPTSAPAETFSITVVNDKHILLTQFNNNATASGSLDLQTAPTSVPTGGNAFALFDAADVYAVGGVLTSNGTAITASEADDDIAGTATFDFAISCTSPCITAPDPSGRGTITFTDPNLGTQTAFAYYVVGPEAFRLIEFDDNAFFAGSMYGQGAGAFSAATLAKPFAFGQSGIESSFVPGFGVYGAAGQFTGNGTAALSGGVADVNEGDGKPVKAGALSGSTYFVNANGYGGITLSGANTDGLANFGVYLVDPAINVTDPNNTSGGGGAVMLDLDANTIGVGFVVPQTTGSTFSGNYAFSQDGVFETPVVKPVFAWYGLVGQIVSYDTSEVEGLADYNELNIAQTPAVTVTGTYAADVANPGRSTAQVTINGAATPNNLTIYQASSVLLLHVDVDSPAAQIGTIGLGVLEQQQ